MTDALKKINARFANIDLETAKQVVRKAYSNDADECDVIVDVGLEHLALNMPEGEFVAFCDELTGDAAA